MSDEAARRELAAEVVAHLDELADAAPRSLGPGIAAAAGRVRELYGLPDPWNADDD